MEKVSHCQRYTYIRRTDKQQKEGPASPPGPHIEKLSYLVTTALDVDAQVVLDNGLDVDGDGLPAASQGLLEVLEGGVLAVLDAQALELEGYDAFLAVLVAADLLENCGLVHVGSDLDLVAARAEQETLNEEDANLVVINVVLELNITLKYWS